MTSQDSSANRDKQFDYSLIEPRLVQAEARRRGVTQDRLAAILKRNQSSVSLAFKGILRHQLEAIARYLVGTGSDFWVMVPYSQVMISNGTPNSQGQRK